MRHEVTKQYHLVLKFQQGAMGTVCVLNPSVVSNSATLWAVHGIFQARILEWVAISSFRGSSQPRDRTCISSLAGRFFTSVPPGKPAVGITGPNIKKSGL